jgi:hypothetical protein
MNLDDVVLCEAQWADTDGEGVHTCCAPATTTKQVNGSVYCLCGDCFVTW